MKVAKKLICTAVALILLVQPFFGLVEAADVTLPPANTPCRYIAKLSEQQNQWDTISCASGITRKFENLRGQFSTVALFGGKRRIFIIDTIIPEAHLAPIKLLVKETNTEKQITHIVWDQGWETDVNVLPNVYSQAIDTFLANPSFSAEWKTEARALKGFVQSLVSRLPIAVQVLQRTNPSAKTVQLCSKYSIKPITDGDGLATLISSTKNEILSALTSAQTGGTGQDQQSMNDARALIEDIYGKADSYITKEEDQGFYKKFYTDPNSLNYPNIEITDALINDLAEMTTALGQLEFSSGFEPLKYWWPGMKQIYANSSDFGGRAGIAMGATIGLAVGIKLKNPWVGLIAAAGTTGVIAGGGLGNIIVLRQNIGNYKSALKQTIKITIAHHYITQNLLYNKCALNEAGDTGFARYTEQYVTSANSLLSSTYGVGNALNTSLGDEKDVCDEHFTGWTIGALIKKAFCGLLLMMKDWADWLYARAKSWLEVSLGVAENKDMVLPEDTSTPPGGPNSPNGTNAPSAAVPLANGGNIKVNDAATLAAIKTQASGNNETINAAIIPVKTSDNTTGQTLPARFVVSASTGNSITANLLSQASLDTLTEYTKFQVQFIAGNKGYKFWITKTGNLYTLSGTDGSQIQPMGSLPTIPGNNTPAPTPTPTASCPTNFAESTIRGQAMALCRTKKSSYSAADWEIGQCLSNSMGNTGYAVDVAHSPRIDSDNQHTCSSPTKWVELNTSCCVIGNEPSNTN